MKERNKNYPESWKIFFRDLIKQNEDINDKTKSTESTRCNMYSILQ